MAQPGTICLCLAPRALHLLSTYLQVLHYSFFQICYKISHPLICPINSSIFVWLTPPPSGSLNTGSLSATYTMTYGSVLMTQQFFWYLSLYKVSGLCFPTNSNFDFCFSHQVSRFPYPHPLRLYWKLRQWLVHVGAIPRSSLISSWSSLHSGFKSFYLYSWETCCYLF